MPIFTQSLQRIDYSNTRDAVKKMVNHIRYIQEQLEYTLSNLDSKNISEIDIDKTVISDSSGTTNIGSYINLTGADGESFRVGKAPSGRFEFSITSAGKKQTMYLDDRGIMVLTNNINLTVDGGEW